MGETSRRRPRRQMMATSRAAISLLSCACACLTIGRVDGFFFAARPAAPTFPPSFPLRSSTCSVLLASSRTSTADQRRSTTYYDILGVSEHSDTAEIKKQYKRLARMTHPDALISSGGSANDSANKKLPDFYEVSTAYKVLSDPKKRIKYDRELAADQFVEGTAELAESVGNTLGGFVVPFISNTAKATVKAAAKTATVVKNTSNQVQENIRKAREEKAERLRQQKLEEERLRAEINEKMRRMEEERLRLEAERAERERVEAERRAEEERIAAAERAEQERLDRIAEDQRMEAERRAEEERIVAAKRAEQQERLDRIAEDQRVEAERRAEEERIAAAERAEQERRDRIAEDQRVEAERIATEAAQKAEEKQVKQLSELEKKFLQLQAEEMLEKKPTQRSQTISLSSAVVVEQDSDYSLDKAIQVSKDEHSGGPRFTITKPSSRRKRTPAIPERKGPSGDAEEEPYDLETALQMSKEPRSFGSKKITTARRTKKSKRKKGQNSKKRKR